MDKQANLEKLAELIIEAGENGAELIVTGETGIPTYPYWRNRFTYTDKDPEVMDAWRQVVVDYYRESVRIPDDLDLLCAAAKKVRAHCVIGISEQSDVPGSNTLFNTQVLIGPNGKVLARHRKLVPTHEERVVWGRGDGSDFNVWKTKLGNIGALVCYENHMPFMKAGLIAMGEEIHVCCWPGWFAGASEKGLAKGATVDVGASDIDSCIREYAYSSQNFVLSASLYVPLDSIPDSFPFKKFGNWDWAVGGSAIVSPAGEYLAGPVFNEEAILYADLDPAVRIRAKHRLDAVGHYARPDIVSLKINNKPFNCIVNEIDELELEAEDPSKAVTADSEAAENE